MGQPTRRLAGPLLPVRKLRLRKGVVCHERVTRRIVDIGQLNEAINGRARRRHTKGSEPAIRHGCGADGEAQESLILDQALASWNNARGREHCRAAATGNVIRRGRVRQSHSGRS